MMHGIYTNIHIITTAIRWSTATFARKTHSRWRPQIIISSIRSVATTKLPDPKSSQLMMTSFKISILIIVVLADAMLAEVNAQVPCFLCGQPDLLPANKDCILDESGITCFDVYKWILISEDRGTCEQNRTKYEDICCKDEDEPNQCYTGPTLPPVYMGETGDEPTCRLCGIDVSWSL